MFKRELAHIIKQRAEKIPVIGILGPRQSGKTTLAQKVFDKHTYISLESYDEREFASKDPHRFIETYKSSSGIILDEIQHVPTLLSYIQTYVDKEHKPGSVVLTGSQNILVNQAISQTLAGRIGLFTLLPLSIAELSTNSLLPRTVEELAFKGSYPRIYAYDLEPNPWYLDYIETYVERDVRQVGNIINLRLFRKFLKICAGRIGQLLNYTSLANDCGIDQRTAQAWIFILEASYIIFLLPPHHNNLNKRLIRSPKLYFYDTGLACALLEILSVSQLNTHYLRGSLIESLIIADIYKYYYNCGRRPVVDFWRDQTGNEIDCLITRDNQLVPIEIKAGKTIASDFFKGLLYWARLTEQEPPIGYVIYGGLQNQQRAQATVLSWQQVGALFGST